MYKQIKCGVCNKRVKGLNSFDEVAKKNKWVKAGKGYICNICNIPKVEEHTYYKKNKVRNFER
jgi:hypothetical protein